MTDLYYLKISQCLVLRNDIDVCFINYRILADLQTVDARNLIRVNITVRYIHLHDCKWTIQTRKFIMEYIFC